MKSRDTQSKPTKPSAGARLRNLLGRSNLPPNSPSAGPFPIEGDPHGNPQPEVVRSPFAGMAETVAAVFRRETETVEQIETRLAAAREGLARAEREVGAATLAVEDREPGADERKARADADLDAVRRRVFDLERALAEARLRQEERVAAARRIAERDRQARIARNIARARERASRVDDLVGELIVELRDECSAVALLHGDAPELTDQIAVAQAAFEACLTSRLRFMPNIRPKPFLDGGDKWAKYFPTPQLHAQLEEQQRQRREIAQRPELYVNDDGDIVAPEEVES